MTAIATVLTGLRLEILIPVLFFTILAFWRRVPILYALAGFALLLFAFTSYSSASWLGLITGGVGIFCLFAMAFDRG